MLDKLDEVDVEELLNLLLDLDLQLWPEVSRCLLDRLSPLYDVEPVDD